MDEELKQLEAELRRLRPVAPPASLAMAMEQRLVRRRQGWIVRWSWVALPMAAALAFLVMRRPDVIAPAAPVVIPPLFRPVAAQNLLLSSEDDGYVQLADGTTARRLRQSYIDTITWQNPRTKASLKWTVPREEVRVVPVLFQ